MCSSANITLDKIVGHRTIYILPKRKILSRLDSFKSLTNEISYKISKYKTLPVQRSDIIQRARGLIVSTLSITIIVFYKSPLKNLPNLLISKFLYIDRFEQIYVSDSIVKYLS